MGTLYCDVGVVIVMGVVVVDAVVVAASPVGVLVGKEGRRGFPDFEKWCGVASDESGRQRQAQAVETLLRGAKETLKTQ